MNPNKTLWEKAISPSSPTERRRAVDALGITAGLEVLGLGCADDTTAANDRKNWPD